MIEEGPVELLEDRLELLAGRDVQVVGRLVEQQEVHPIVHQAGELHATLLAAAESGDGAVQVVALEEEAVQQVAGRLVEQAGAVMEPVDQWRVPSITSSWNWL